MNWPFKVLAWRGWCLLNYNEGSECDNRPSEGYRPSVTSLMCRPQHQRLPHILKHFISRSNLYSCFPLLHTDRFFRIHAIIPFFFFNIISQFNQQSQWEHLHSSTHHFPSDASWNAAHAACSCCWVAVGSKRKVTDCLRVAPQLSAHYFCFPDIDCSSDILTFALNQACTGKGLLIRQPLKTAPTSSLHCVWIPALSPSQRSAGE